MRPYPDMVRTKIGHPRHTKERERRRHLLDQNVGRSTHTSLAAGHQPVEVSPSQQGTLRPQRDRSDDVAARHHTSVDVDLDPVAHRVDH